MHPEDHNFQRIFWCSETSSHTREFQLNTVTYGLTCAPFLALRTLRQLADDEESNYPRGALALRHDSYVVDIVTGAETLPDAIALQRELRGLCTAGWFPLRKWAANDREILDGIPSEHQLHQTPHSWEDERYATLGLRWHPSEDSFAFSIHPRTVTTCTKITVLAESARLFDPLGWLAPVTMRAKILIQSAWLQHFDWDSVGSSTGCFGRSAVEDLPHGAATTQEPTSHSLAGHRGPELKLGSAQVRRLRAALLLLGCWQSEARSPLSNACRYRGSSFALQLC